MSIRQFQTITVVACLFAFVSTLPAQNREQDEIVSELHTLRLAYRDEMMKVVDSLRQRYRDGMDNADGLFTAQNLLADAELAVAIKPGQRIAALESALESLKTFESDQMARFNKGTGRSDELAKCTAARIFAEIRLLEERQNQNRASDEFASELRTLRLSYRDAMVKLVDAVHRRSMNGTNNLNGLLEAQFSLSNAELAVAAKPTERIVALESSLKSFKNAEAYQVVRLNRGTGRSDELAKCTASRIFAEIRLVEERKHQYPDRDEFVSELRTLRNAYREELVRVVDIMRRRHADGTDNVNWLLQAEIALAHAELTLAAGPADRIAALDSALELLKKSEAYQVVRHRSGTGRSDELANSVAARIEGEIRLLEERQRQNQAK